MNLIDECTSQVLKSLDTLITLATGDLSPEQRTRLAEAIAIVRDGLSCPCAAPSNNVRREDPAVPTSPRRCYTEDEADAGPIC